MALLSGLHGQGPLRSRLWQAGPDGGPTVHHKSAIYTIGIMAAEARKLCEVGPRSLRMPLRDRISRGPRLGLVCSQRIPDKGDQKLALTSRRIMSEPIGRRLRRGLAGLGTTSACARHMCRTPLPRRCPRQRPRHRAMSAKPRPSSWSKRLPPGGRLSAARPSGRSGRQATFDWRQPRSVSTKMLKAT